MEADAHSTYVGKVDSGATAEELEAHFHGCGSVNHVTILCDKFSGHPKEFAYIEFSDKQSVRASLALDDFLFRGRQIKVIPKRTNRPGISTADQGFPQVRFRARTPDYNSSPSQFYSGFNSRPWGHVYRGWARETSWYSPYLKKVCIRRRGGEKRKEGGQKNLKKKKKNRRKEVSRTPAPPPPQHICSGV